MMELDVGGIIIISVCILEITSLLIVQIFLNNKYCYF